MTVVGARKMSALGTHVSHFGDLVGRARDTPGPSRVSRPTCDPWLADYATNWPSQQNEQAGAVLLLKLLRI